MYRFSYAMRHNDTNDMTPPPIIPVQIFGKSQNRAKLKKLFDLNSGLNWGAQISRFQNTLIIFLSAIAEMQVIFLTGDNFCFISDCINSFNCKRKKLINE